MTAAQPQESAPLRPNREGAIRVGETRVTLETVVSSFDSGATPEEICEDFPSLRLPDVYAVLTYVLRNRVEVDRYLARRREAAAATRREIEATPENQRLRERILARRQR